MTAIPRSRIITSARPSRSIWRALAAALFFLPVLPLAVLAGASADASDTAGEIGTRKGWRVYLADACSDTLAASVPDIIPSVERTLKADEWRIDHADASRGDVVTSWKRIQHPLARILLGKIEARCAVVVRPLDPRRTVVTIQGGIASREDVSANPALVLARHAYRNATLGWQRELRDDLTAHRELVVGTP